MRARIAATPGARPTTVPSAATLAVSGVSEDQVTDASMGVPASSLATAKSASEPPARAQRLGETISSEAGVFPGADELRRGLGGGSEGEAAAGIRFAS